jgi:hypothetical protein
MSDVRKRFNSTLLHKEWTSKSIKNLTIGNDGFYSRFYSTLNNKKMPILQSTQPTPVNEQTSFHSKLQFKNKSLFWSYADEEKTVKYELPRKARIPKITIR